MYITPPTGAWPLGRYRRFGLILHRIEILNCNTDLFKQFDNELNYSNDLDNGSPEDAYRLPALKRGGTIEEMAFKYLSVSSKHQVREHN